MTRMRARYRGKGPGIWSGIREGLRWLMRLPMRLLRRRDYPRLHAAMAQLSPRMLTAEAGIYWVEPPDAGVRLALAGMREPTTGVLERLPAGRRYLILNLREAEIPAPYELPDPTRFRAMRFPLRGGMLPEREEAVDLFQDLAAFAEEPADLPPALLFHCKEGVSRTPQMLCAWLVWRERLTPEEAARRVQEAQEEAEVSLFVPDGRERAWLRTFADETGTAAGSQA